MSSNSGAEYLKTRCLEKAGHVETEDDPSKDLKLFLEDCWRCLYRDVRNQPEQPAAMFQASEQQQYKQSIDSKKSIRGYYNTLGGR